MKFDSKTGRAAGKRSSRKGIPNGSTGEMKSFYAALITGQQSKIEKELQKLEGKDYLNVILKLSEYVVPKQRQVEQIVDLSKLSNSEVDTLFDRVLKNYSDEEEL